MNFSKKQKIWVAVLSFPIFIVLAAYFFAQSSFVREHIAAAASDALGSQIEFGDDISINSIFPSLGFSIPNARLKTTTESSGGLQRARLENVQVSLSPSVVFDSTEPADIELQIERATLIYNVPQDAKKSGEQAQRDIDVSQMQDAVATLADSVNGLSQIRVQLFVADVDYFQRDAALGNKRYRIKDVALVAADAAVTLDAIFIHESRYEQQIEVTIKELATSTRNGKNAINGAIELEVSPSLDFHTAAKLNASFDISDSGFELAQLDASTDWLWFRGEASGSWDTTDVNVDADIEIRSLELGAIGSTPPTAVNSPNGSQSSNQPSADTQDRRVFPYEPFAFALPLNLSSEVSLKLGAVRLDTMPIANGTLNLTLSDGILDVTSEDLSLFGGDSSFSLEIDNTLQQLMAIRLKLDSDDLQLERIRVGNNGDSIMSRGTADAIIALRGEGPSPGHIASSLDGYVLASLANAQVNQRYSTLIDRGLVQWAIDKVSLLRNGGNAESTDTKSLSNPLDLDCAVLKVYINDGRAEVSNGAIIEFPENSLFSSGYVDLASEKLGFAFRTKSKSLFDWSAISIIKYAELSGTLADPKAAFNATELAKQGIKTASSAAWGPLPSLVYSLAEAGLKNASNKECTPQIN